MKKQTENENGIIFYKLFTSLLRLKNNELSDGDKLTLTLIISLSQKHGMCYAKNNYMAKELGKTPRSITNHVATLRNKGYITYTLENLTDRKIYLTEKTIDLLEYKNHTIEEVSKGIEKVIKGTIEEMSKNHRRNSEDTREEIDKENIENNRAVALETDKKNKNTSSFTENEVIPSSYYTESEELVPLKDVSFAEKKENNCRENDLEALEEFNPSGKHEVRKELNTSYNIITAVMEENRKHKEEWERKQQMKQQNKS